MSYTVLARKYRPQTFVDLVGQEHVTRTLSNAIATGRVAHAFLFTGVRGVGKTTSARILAKALNCEQGPSASPCNACDPCMQITTGVDLDVLEIDGASNNGVDDVRRLQESLPYRPARDRYKIVIVDEVHMLTTAAFNAFLKTLEEPPPHVKFIFATTEAHKVPVTIRSRCQRYDFRLIPQAVIAEHVAKILQAEQLEADAQAVAIVAREAGGSMRDALTLLDQVVAFSGDKLFGSEVAQKLGIADRDHLFQAVDAVVRADAKRALEVIDAVASQGLDLTHFARQWLDLMRDVIVLRIAADRPELVELPDEERTRAAELAGAVELLELERVFAGISKLIDEVSRTNAPRIALEMGAVRLATRPPLHDLSELIARLTQLEAGGGGAAPSGGARAPARPAPGAPEPTRVGAPERRAEPPVSTRAVAPGRDAAPSKPNPFQRFIPPESSASPSRPTFDGGRPAALDTPRAVTVAPPRTPPTAPAPMAATAAAPQLAKAPDTRARSWGDTPPSNTSQPVAAPSPPALSLARAPTPASPAPQNAVAPAESASSATIAKAPPAAGRQAPSALWRSIVEQLRAGDARWAAMFEHGYAQELSGERVVVVFQEGSFFGRQAQSQGGIDALQRAARTVLSADPQLEVRFAPEVQGVTIAQHEAAALDERREAIRRRALNHPRVLEALKVFPELGQKQDVQID